MRACECGSYNGYAYTHKPLKASEDPVSCAVRH